MSVLRDNVLGSIIVCLSRLSLYFVVWDWTQPPVVAKADSCGQKFFIIVRVFVHSWLVHFYFMLFFYSWCFLITNENQFNFWFFCWGGLKRYELFLISRFLNFWIKIWVDQFFCLNGPSNLQVFLQAQYFQKIIFL